MCSKPLTDILLLNQLRNFYKLHIYWEDALPLKSASISSPRRTFYGCIVYENTLFDYTYRLHKDLLDHFLTLSNPLQSVSVLQKRINAVAKVGGSWGQQRLELMMALMQACALFIRQFCYVRNVREDEISNKGGNQANTFAGRGHSINSRKESKSIFKSNRYSELKNGNTDIKNFPSDIVKLIGCNSWCMIGCRSISSGPRMLSELSHSDLIFLKMSPLLTVEERAKIAARYEVWGSVVQLIPNDLLIIPELTTTYLDRGRPRTTRTPYLEQRVLEHVEENPETSVRRISAVEGVAKSVVWNILHEQLLYPYHVQLCSLRRCGYLAAYKLRAPRVSRHHHCIKWSRDRLDMNRPASARPAEWTIFLRDDLEPTYRHNLHRNATC
ncbi:hypothetical protein C0J52_23302 [Blattella germanica]|nr:hypothetical protein C0J52_23302 [Blattella germanica]